MTLLTRYQLLVSCKYVHCCDMCDAINYYVLTQEKWWSSKSKHDDYIISICRKLHKNINIRTVYIIVLIWLFLYLLTLYENEYSTACSSTICVYVYTCHICMLSAKSYMNCCVHGAYRITKELYS